MIVIRELLNGVHVVGKLVRAGDIKAPGQLPAILGSSDLMERDRLDRSCFDSTGKAEGLKHVLCRKWGIRLPLPYTEAALTQFVREPLQ